MQDSVHAERELRRFRALAEQTTDFVAMADAQRRLLYVNPAGLALVGLPADVDVSTLRLTDVVAAAAHERLEASLAETVRAGVWTGEMELVDRSGAVIPVEEVRIAHQDDRGVVEYFSSVARDLRERRAAEAARRDPGRRAGRPRNGGRRRGPAARNRRRPVRHRVGGRRADVGVHVRL